MLILLSPAKSLDFETKLATRKHSEPRLVNESEKLISVMREKSPDEISKLMDISEDLATLNAERYARFDVEHTPGNSRPAALAFNGDVYQGLAAPTFDARDLTEAQKVIRILSGLYGVLRPLDLIQPHRLEMGTRLRTSRGRNLYEWWGDKVTDQLKRDLDCSPGADVVVNLASNEYFGVVRPERLGVRIISPRFEDFGPDGAPRVVSFYAKRARGLMARWLVQERARTASRLLEFTAEGYELDEKRSTKDQPVFVR
ncbi:peroxide stress protein YaaA [Tessaracoccus sp. OS52]|uniref:peroxide stress protein YaaA n=1 Tax=Tessaracoccus sp. OS52 TaxID=2886691 RepID=UPI001D12713E|nr:peroxide stress protein YaaA [Tessaracoccus sp. OS52]MCC2594195.1 peroxide stress protein YaaA [Tessaracoccus sp. OS52]